MALEFATRGTESCPETVLSVQQLLTVSNINNIQNSDTSTAIDFSAIGIITNLLYIATSIIRIADTAPPTPIQASVRYKLICY